MISSLFFVLFVTAVVIISMAIPTLHLERTEVAGSGSGGRTKTRLAWNQVNISPYRGVWMSSWILFLILCYTSGKAMLPPLDLDIKLFQTSTTMASTPTPNQSRDNDNRPTETASTTNSTPTQETESSVLPIPESEEETETPPEDSASVSTETEKREDMDEYRGRIPDWAVRDEEDPIL